MNVEFGCRWFWFQLYVGWGGDRMRALSVRLGAQVLGVSNWNSWAVGRWTTSRYTVS